MLAGMNSEVPGHELRHISRDVREILDLLRAAHGHLATKTDLQQTESKIMSAISDFATKLTGFFDRQDKAVADLQGDVDNLTKQIAALQATSGAITPEDQALLDGIQTRASTISDKLDALDALTPPVAPPAP